MNWVKIPRDIIVGHLARRGFVHRGVGPLIRLFSMSRTKKFTPRRINPFLGERALGPRPERGSVGILSRPHSGGFLPVPGRSQKPHRLLPLPR